MADENQIEISIVLDDGSVQRGFANIKKSANDAAEDINKGFSVKSLALFTAGVYATSKAISFLKDSISDGISEAIEAEQVNLKLASAINSVPGATSNAVASFSAFASELSNLVAIDDDVIKSNAALLASVGRLSGEGLENATKAAIDLSAGLGISLESAFKRVSLAAEGNVTGLQKIGFEFTKGASDAVKFEQALAQINERFGGLAQGQAVNTFGGLIQSLKVAFADSNQALGELITNSPAVRELLKFILEGFRASTEAIKEFSKAGTLDTIIIRLVDFARAINSYLVVPIEVFINGFKAGFTLIDIIVKGAISNFATLGEAITRVLGAVGIENSFTKGIQEFAQASRTVTGDAIQDFANLRSVLDTPLSDGLGASIDSLSARLANLKPVTDVTKQSLTETKDAVAALTGEITNGILFGQQFDSTFSAIGSAFTQIAANFKAAALDIGISAKSIAKSILGGVGTAAANAFSAFGRAIVEGTNALDAFVNSLLASLGQMAVQVGSQFILQGIAYSLAGLPNGPALIGAGAALATFGGVLSALGGKSATAAAPVDAGGGATTPTAGFEIPDDSIADTTRERAAREALVVNINGDILGDEGSGQRLVSLINSAFDVGGVELRQGLT